VFLATGAALVFVPARRADAFLFDIVLDPVALVENVLKVVDLGEQIDAVVQQVENEVKELEHLNLSAVPNIAGIVSGVEGQLNSSLYSTANPASQLDTRYPADMINATWAQYQSDQSTWTDNQRQSLVENRQLQNQVYQDMDTTNQQVQDIVDASNSASGETSAIQAHNDLLAVASGELAKLQSLKIARARVKTERLAQQQSESSYAEAERQRVRTGWDNPAPPTETVVDPFQN
jgi:P-type conjugative transfer protein TrbJ